MKREEAIKFLELDKKDRGKCYISEAIDIAIKALEQEPCEDCISRRATVKRLFKVADFMNEKRKGLGTPYIMAALFIQDNKDEFPPVTSKKKDKALPSGLGAYKWCPNCGMQERSDKHLKIQNDLTVEKIMDEIEKEFEKVEIPSVDKITIFAKVQNALYKCAVSNSEIPNKEIKKALKEAAEEIRSEIIHEPTTEPDAWFNLGLESAARILEGKNEKTTEHKVYLELNPFESGYIIGLLNKTMMERPEDKVVIGPIYDRLTSECKKWYEE